MNGIADCKIVQACFALRFLAVLSVFSPLRIAYAHRNYGQRFGRFVMALVGRTGCFAAVALVLAVAMCFAGLQLSNSIGPVALTRPPMSPTVEVPSSPNHASATQLTRRTDELRTPTSPTSSGAKAALDAASHDVSTLHAELMTLGLPACVLDALESNFQRQRLNGNATKSGVSTSGFGIPAAGIDMVYMVHYTRGAAQQKRRRLMEAKLSLHGVSPFWVLGFDKDDLSPPLVRCLHEGWAPANYSGLRKAARHQVRPVSRLKLSQLSVVAKHHSALYDFVRRSSARGKSEGQTRWALVLEDDAFLRAGFSRFVGDVLREAAVLRPGVGVIMVGGCMRMHAYRGKFRTTKLSKHLYAKLEARCAHAFLVSDAAAKRFVASAPFTLPIDFQLTAAMREMDIDCLWVEPWLSIQGDLGGCVTNDIGAGCVSVEKKYNAAFDEKRMNETAVLASWESVPEMGAK